MRVTVGTVFAFTLYHAFNLPQGYWAVFTVVIVMQASIGATLSASRDRLIGTAAGAVVGGVAAAIRPETPLGLGAALAICVGVTSFAAAQRPTLKVAPITAVIMLISPTVGMGPLHAALYRVVEIAIGSVIALVASLFVFPARSQQVVTERVDQTLSLLAELLDAYAGEFLVEESGFDGQAQHEKIRASLGGIETAMADAARERSSRLGEHRVSEAVPRTLWRVRNDTVPIGRALVAGLPAATARLAFPAADMLRAEAEFMRACGQAIVKETRIDRAALDAAHDRYQAAVEALRRENLTSGLTFEAVGRMFSLAFALESLYRNLRDLADRIEESFSATGEEAVSPSTKPESP